MENLGGNGTELPLFGFDNMLDGLLHIHHSLMSDSVCCSNWQLTVHGVLGVVFIYCFIANIRY